jgi:amidophosphoribosyltransferase
MVEALVRNEYVGRTFIEPDDRRRAAGLNVKFNLGEPVAGRRVVLVDDSIVRGSTMRRITRMLWDAGAREIHVRIAAPPLVGPCGYGVDIASEHELVAAGRTSAEVAAIVGATTVAYLSMAGLNSAVGDDGLCRSCITGRKEQV